MGGDRVQSKEIRRVLVGTGGFKTGDHLYSVLGIIGTEAGELPSGAPLHSTLKNDQKDTERSKDQCL